MAYYDDHVWLTVHGEAWAIRRIERDEAGTIVAFQLWRGYWPNIETKAVRVIDADWPRYCDAARAVIDAQLRPLV